MNVLKLIFGEWNQWKDVSCAESCGYIIIVQTRTNKNSNKRQIRKVKFWLNDSSKIKEIQQNMFN